MKKHHKQNLPPNATIKLPPLLPQDALFLAHIFERLRDAIWQAHGDTMGDYLEWVHSGTADHNPQQRPPF